MKLPIVFGNHWNTWKKKMAGMESSRQGDGLLTLKQVAELLNVHPNTLRRWIKDGRIPSYRISSRGDRRFKQEEIARFLAELDVK
jgi:excisionase family DNA binding protein